MATHITRTVARPTPVFADRQEAGRALAERLRPPEEPSALVAALPRGGIPVGRPIADTLGTELRPVFVRKLPIPTSPEMGFGAVTVDGTVVLNDPVVDAFGIDPSTIERVTEETLEEVRRRARTYPGGYPLPDLEDRSVILVDDGLATGFTALTAARMLRAHGVRDLTLAVPVSPVDSLDRLEPEVDEAYCLIVQTAPRFAVASYYRRFPDLTDDEVVELL